MYSFAHGFVPLERACPEVYSSLNRVAIVPPKRPAAFPTTVPSGFSSKLDPSVYELFVYTSMASTLHLVGSFANLLVDILVLVT